MGFPEYFKKISKTFDLIAAIILLLTCLLVVLNIITRSLFDAPIFGIYEIVCYTSLIMVSLALANCAIQGGHINLTLLLEKLSPKNQRFLEIILSVVILINFVLISWNLVLYMIARYVVGDVSAVLRIPLQYIVVFIVFGFVLLTLTPLVKIIEEIRKLHKASLNNNHNL